MVEVIHGRAYGAMHWDAGRVTYSVDGRAMGWINHNLGHDHAHGGTDVVMSLMNGSNDTHLTVYEVSYTPSDDAWEDSKWDWRRSFPPALFFLVIRYPLNTGPEAHVESQVVCSAANDGSFSSIPRSRTQNS
jgi:hypothetical protein